MEKVQKFTSLFDYFKHCPQNEIIGNNFIKAYTIINRPAYKKIMCSISGGQDSDIILDIVYKCDINNKVEYVWFDTGLEYEATKKHLKYLEGKYDIEILRSKPKKPIPTACNQYGQPFLSKQVSEFLMRLQRHNFQWEDDTFENLLIKYPKCKSALQWWCNKNKSLMLNIDKNKYLKEFIMHNPPLFSISNKCCLYAKKDISHSLIHERQYDLLITGIRRNEGGVRKIAYKNCFNINDDVCDHYRPIFFYNDSDKEEYLNFYNIKNSDCYEKYGLLRTGCAGCPFGRNFEFELNVLQQFEPKLFKAVNHIFKDSFEYTRKYRDFIEEKKQKAT